MILFVRKHFNKNLMRGMIVVMSFSLVGIGLFTGIANLVWQKKGGVLSVNGKWVSRSLFNLRVKGERRVIEFYKEQLGDLTPLFMNQMGMSMSAERNASTRLINDLVLSSFVEKLKLWVDPSFVARKIQDQRYLMSLIGMNLPAKIYDTNGKLNTEFLKRILAANGMSLEDFEMIMEQGAKKELAVKIMSLSTPITNKEIEEMSIKQLGERTFTITTYSLKPFEKIARCEAVTDENLKNFYEEKMAQSNVSGTEKKDFLVMKKDIEREYYKAKAQKMMIEELEGVGVSPEHVILSKQVVLKKGSDAKKIGESLGLAEIAWDRVERMVTESAKLRGIGESYGYTVILEKIERPATLGAQERSAYARDTYKRNRETIIASSVDSLIKSAKIKGDTIN